METARAKPARILIVDDEPRNLKLLEAALRPKNHRILGLGLTLVKKITDLGQGDIKLQSTLGEGTTFTIRFPER